MIFTKHSTRVSTWSAKAARTVSDFELFNCIRVWRDESTKPLSDVSRAKWNYYFDMNPKKIILKILVPSNKRGSSGGNSRDWTSEGTIDKRWPRIISMFSLTTPESISFKLENILEQVHQMTEDSSCRKYKKYHAKSRPEKLSSTVSSRLSSSKSTFSALFSWVVIMNTWKATWSMLIWTENRRHITTVIMPIISIVISV